MLKRYLVVLLCFILIFSLFSFFVFASNDTYYLDVTPSSNLVGTSPNSVFLALNLPSWAVGTSGTLLVIGRFGYSFPSLTYPDYSGSDVIANSSDLYVGLLNGPLDGFCIIGNTISKDISYQIYGVYLIAPQFDSNLSSLGYVSSDNAQSISSLSFSNVSVPFTSGSASYHYLRIPGSQLSLAESLSLDFTKYLSYSDPDPSLDVAVFSGSQQIGYQLSQTDHVYSISVTDLNPNFDLFIRVSFPDYLALSIEKATIRYGPLFSDSDVLIKINNLLNSNFSSLKDLLSNQIEILDSNNSWLGRIHTAISNGFTSVGQWFTSLWNNISGAFSSLGSTISTGFSNVRTWIQNQTDTLGAKLDALINGTQAQQEAAQQAQQDAANMQQNVDNASGQLGQISQSFDNVVKPTVNMSLDGFGVDYTPLIALTSPLTQDRTIEAILGIMAVLMLLSYVIFGKK